MENDKDIINKMTEWIEHPLEFGKKTSSIEIIDKRKLFWMSQKPEDCYLLKYKMDDSSEFIGFTGPITWTFFDIDFSKIKLDDLYIKYTGWYIAFSTINSEGYDGTKADLNEKKVINNLIKTGYSNVNTLQKIYIAGNTYYEFLCKKNDKEVKLVGAENNLLEYPVDFILPFYQYLGDSWDPLNL